MSYVPIQNDENGLHKRGSLVDGFGRMMEEHGGMDFANDINRAGTFLVGFINNGDWREFIPCKKIDEEGRYGYEQVPGMSHVKGEVVRHETLDSFINAPIPKGLGGHKRLERHMELLPDKVREQLKMALVAAEVKTISQIRSESIQKRWDGEAIQSYPGNFVSSLKSQRGNSVDYLASRLARSGRKDLIDMVAEGKMTTRQAAKAAGLDNRAARMEVTPGTDPVKLGLWLAMNYNREALATLCRNICEVAGEEDYDEEPGEDTTEAVATSLPVAKGGRVKRPRRREEVLDVILNGKPFKDGKSNSNLWSNVLATCDTDAEWVKARVAEACRDRDAELRSGE